MIGNDRREWICLTLFDKSSLKFLDNGLTRAGLNIIVRILKIRLSMKMQDATMMVHHRSAVGRHVAKDSETPLPR